MRIRPQQTSPPTCSTSKGGINRDIFFGFDQGFNSERFSDNLLILCRLLHPTTHCSTPTTSTTTYPPHRTKKQKVEHHYRQAEEEQQPIKCAATQIDLCNDEVGERVPQQAEEDDEEIEETEAMEGEGEEQPTTPNVVSPIDESMKKQGNSKHHRKRRRSESLSSSSEAVGESSSSNILVFNDEEPDSDQVEVMEELHVNSLLLSSRSEFFHALFTNGMKETSQKGVRKNTFTLIPPTHSLIPLVLYTKRYEYTWNTRRRISSLRSFASSTQAVWRCAYLFDY